MRTLHMNLDSFSLSVQFLFQSHSVNYSMLTQAAVHYLVFYSIFSIVLLLPIICAAFFGHFEHKSSYFADDDRLTVFLQIFIQIFASIGIAYSAIKTKANFLVCGLIYFIFATIYYIWKFDWLIREAFDCDETECEFYGFSMLIYFATGKKKFQGINIE